MSTNEPSILKQLKYSFLGFGLLMGLVFPFYASLFVNWKAGMLLWFCVGCIFAGITVGIVNHKLLEWLLISKLRQCAIASQRIRNGDLRGGCGIRSSDTIGEITEGFDAMTVSLREIVSEIQTIVEAGVQGDFSKKMDLRGKQGFGKDIATELNQLYATTEAGLNDVMRVTNALAAGDLTQKITKDYPGVLGQTKTGVNNIVDSLTRTVGEIRDMVHASASRGDFNTELDLTGKAGYARELAELLNQLSIVTVTGLNELAHMLHALSQGNLDEKITGEYYGIFAQLKDDANRTAEQLNEILLNEVGRVLDALSRGDLTEKIRTDHPGVFGQLKDDANSTVDKLRAIIAQVKNSSDLINTAAQEITADNNDLSQRTEEQASILQETASSMGELLSTVRRNTESARHANQLAQGTSDIADQSGKAVAMLVATMTAINASSRKVEDIISVIDGIAFQTNILALNAAVEAARAGEQGRGFAVVASEVRSLAQRSAAAAKEIKQLIIESVEKISVGSTQVKEAADEISDVVTSVQLVASLMKDITAATAEQGMSIEQINITITRMDDVTQQNAALVEEASAAAESMQQQVGALDVVVSTFRLDERGVRGAIARHVAPPPETVAAQGKERKLAKTKPDIDGDWKVF